MNPDSAAGCEWGPVEVHRHTNEQIERAFRERHGDTWQDAIDALVHQMAEVLWDAADGRTPWQSVDPGLRAWYLKAAANVLLAKIKARP